MTEEELQRSRNLGGLSSDREMRMCYELTNLINQQRSRIAELEADNKTWESLENDRAEEIGKLMARVTELEKEIADWFLTVSERDEQIERLREDIALLEKELSNTETASEVTFQKWQEYCQRNGLEGL